jgi:4'-phosphopantetheinyl transferase
MDQVVDASRETISRPRGTDVSLWRAPLEISPTEMKWLRSHLSVEERARESALRRSRDRDRFAIAHGWLRHLLGVELGCRPADVPILTAAGGKPTVEGSDIRFSASRSRGLALFAIARGTEVGVDIEAIGPEADIDRVAALFFSPAERRALEALAPDERLRGAFLCWTCKEAYFKGIGTGLVHDARNVDTWTGGPEPARVGDWCVREVKVTAGFEAAVAIQNGGDAVVQVQGARI